MNETPFKIAYQDGRGVFVLKVPTTSNEPKK